MSRSKRRALEPRLDAVPDREVRHQVAREELTRPRAAHLPAEVLHRNAHVLLLQPRDDAPKPRRDLRDDGVDALSGDRRARVRDARAVVHPLPQLHARDLRGRRVLHEVVQRDAPVPADPRRGVRETRLDVLAHARGGDPAGHRRVQQVRRGDLHLGAQVVVLVGPEHVLVEHLARDLVDERVRDPCAVVSGSDLTELVRADLGHGDFVSLGVVLDGI